MQKPLIQTLQIVVVLLLLWQIPVCTIAHKSCLLQPQAKPTAAERNNLMEPSQQAMSDAAYSHEQLPQPTTVINPAINVPPAAAKQSNSHAYYFNSANEWVGYSNSDPTQAAQTPAAGQVNINTASAEQLMTLHNIGAAKAEAILQYRATHGKFKSVAELDNVKGIGQKLITKNQDRIVL